MDFLNILEELSEIKKVGEYEIVRYDDKYFSSYNSKSTSVIKESITLNHQQYTPNNTKQKDGNQNNNGQSTIDFNVTVMFSKNANLLKSSLQILSKLNKRKNKYSNEIKEWIKAKEKIIKEQSDILIKEGRKLLKNADINFMNRRIIRDEINYIEQQVNKMTGQSTGREM